LRFVPVLPEAELEQVRKQLKQGEAILWTPVAGGLEARRVVTGLVGEQYTEVAGDGIVEGLDVAIPLRKDDSTPRRRGISLF
jgi:hypothetical protein